jgi:hypothetical protein
VGTDKLTFTLQAVPEQTLSRDNEELPEPGVVVHTYNPSYSGGGDGRIIV